VSPLDKEGGEVQKTANHNVLTAGVARKALLAVKKASCAHGKTTAIDCCLNCCFTCFTPRQRPGVNQIFLLSVLLLNE